MFKKKVKFISILVAIILLFSMTSVFADNESDNDIALISLDNTSAEVNDGVVTTSSDDSYKKSDVYLTGENVVIDYTVDGNLFVMADTVTIKSQIGGDAFIMAKNIIIEDHAYVFNNLFAIADSIEIKGIVYDVYSLSQTLTINGGYIYRDVKSSCNTITINGWIGRNVFVNCSEALFNTNGDTKASIVGDFNYSSDNEMSIPEGIISGSTNYTKTSAQKESTQSIIRSNILSVGTFIVLVLIIWLLCSWITPKFLENTNKFVGKRTLKVLGIGFVTAIVVPVIFVILLLLKLTSSVALILIALYALALVLSKSLFTITANNYVCSKLNVDKKSVKLGFLILSSIVVWVISIIPYIGFIASIIITLLGLGILVSSIIPEKGQKNIELKNED